MSFTFGVRRSAREATIVAIGQIGAALATVVTVKLLTHYLDPAAFGSVAVVTSYVSVIVTVVAAGLANAGAMNLHETIAAGEAQQFIGSVFVGSLSVAAPALLLAASPHVRDALGKSLAFPGLAACGLLLLFADTLKVPGMAIAASARWRIVYTVLQLIDGWGKLAAVVLIAQWVALSARAVLMMYVANGLLAAAVAWWFLFRRLVHKEGSWFSAAMLRRTIRHGWYFAGIGAVGWVLNLSDRVILSALVPAAAVGIYVAGYQIALILPMGLTMVLNAFVQPILLQWQATAPDRARILLGRAMMLNLWVLAPTIVAVMARRDLLIRLAGSEKYQAAADVILWAGPGISFLAVSGTASIAFWMSKRADLFFRISLVAGIVNVLINVAFIPRFGYMAAAVSTFVAMAVQMAGTVVVGRRCIPWKIDTAGLASIAAGVASLIAVLRLFGGRLPWMVEASLLVSVYVTVSGALYLFFADDARSLALRVLARSGQRSA